MPTCKPAAVVLFGVCCCLPTNVCRAASRTTPIDLAAYTARLRSFYGVLDGCAQTMSQAACDSALAGPDIAVRWQDGVRPVEFDWLRFVLEQAASAAASPKGAAEKKQALETAAAGLRDARVRLDQELAQQYQKNARDVAPQRAALEKILASGDYAREVPPTRFERLRDAFFSWLLRHLNAVTASQGSQIIVNLLLVSLLAIVCAGMLWWLARKVNAQRLALLPPNPASPAAPSFLDWEQWLEQGKAFARQQQWRQGIHHVYWAAISLLESRGFWPADRTRTPREYLTLLAARPETVADLRPLTSSFEHTWYGHAVAGQAEFDHACALLQRLAR